MYLYIKQAFEGLIKTIRRLRARQYIGDRDWTDVFLNNRLSYAMVAGRPRELLNLRLGSNELRLPKCAEAYGVISAHQTLLMLDKLSSCSMHWCSSSRALVVEYSGAEYLAGSREEVEILGEVLCEGVYDLVCPYPALIFDVGANVGYTSIYLASSNPQAVVIACEPLGASFEKAARNLLLNSKLARRIILGQFGLYSTAGCMKLSSAPDKRGCSSAVIDRGADGNSEIEVVDVQMKHASSFISQSIAEFPGRRLILKMDCEGSEYAILSNLAESKVIDRLDVVVLEWHKVDSLNLGTGFLEEYFKRHGFTVCFRQRNITTSECGMAYAFRVRMGEHADWTNQNASSG